MANVLKKEPCPECGPEGDGHGDNLVQYDDGSAHCYACHYHISTNKDSKWFSGEYMSIVDRGLTKETCEKYGVQVFEYKGKRACNFNRYKNGALVTQKIRQLDDKSVQFSVGDGKIEELFGQSLFSPTDKIHCVVTEGELDSLAVYQMTGGYPAVSIPKGSSGAFKSIAANLKWLQEWKYVILAFDNDEPGQDAAKACVPLFEVGKVRLARFPLKDANDMLVAGKVEQAKKCLWDAEVIRPDSIVTMRDIQAEVLERPTVGLDWPWETLNKVTYGFRTREIYVVGAATGVGKTEVVKELVFHLMNRGVKVGLFSFEQKAADTARRMIGAKVGKRLHIPGQPWWDEGEIIKQMEVLSDSLYLYYNRGMLTLSEIVVNMRYMVKCYGVKLIVLDNLTAMCGAAKIEGKSVHDSAFIGHVMNTLASIVHELDVSILAVSHLAQDKIGIQSYVSTSPKNEASLHLTASDMDKIINKPGMNWETGRMPKLENLYGSGHVSRLADYIMVLSRNRASEDELEKRTTKVKFLKTRIDSANEGKEFELLYDYDTGKLQEILI